MGVGVAVGLAVAVGEGVGGTVAISVEAGVNVTGDVSATGRGVLVGDTADRAVRNVQAVNVWYAIRRLAHKSIKRKPLRLFSLRLCGYKPSKCIMLSTPLITGII